jgi:hypothetical protein
MPSTTKTVTTTTALLAAATMALAGAGAGPATAASATKCGNVKTSNGGQARSITVRKVSCKSARAIAKRASGKNYKAYGLTCRPLVGLYVCTKRGTTKTVSFGYRKPTS